MKSHFGMFAKYWQPGAVKTRLARGIGDQLAADVYRAFVVVLLRRFADTADSRELAFTPNDRHDDFQAVAPSTWELHPQCKGDLGGRMKHFFQQAFARGANQVVLIGSDSPTLPHEYVDLAFNALDDHAVVLGPSEDGGYYLVGGRDETPPIFDHIRWSTATVWERTLERLGAAGSVYEVLPTWYDVDTEADLRRLSAELASGLESDADLRQLQSELTRALRA